MKHIKKITKTLQGYKVKLTNGYTIYLVNISDVLHLNNKHLRGL